MIISVEMFFKLAIALVTLSVVCAQLTPPSIPPTSIRRVRPGPVVQTRNGLVQGQEETYDVFRRINTFKGIPYGRAPIGNMRFREAIPPASWTGVRRAWEYGQRCPQFTIFTERFTGDEDCLHLNIATPTNIRSRLPVAFLIHGGGLQAGAGQMNLLGPELQNQENVIFVSFNYRLNVFGFLNTGDRHSPGNYGLKDMILALQWVRDNIEFFGGNPNDVTIIGASGGAVAIHALVLSEAASGLFHKAVATSGSLFNNWAFNRNPIENARDLVQRLQLHVTSNEDMVNQLRQVSALRLMTAAGGLVGADSLAFNELNFMPAIDPTDSLETRVITAPIQTLARSGNINTVPFMVGFNSAESLYAITMAQNDPLALQAFNQNPNLLVPSEWNLAPNSADALAVISAFRSLYFGGAQNITIDMAEQWSNYVSDREYIFGISKLARFHSRRQPVFYYRFSYSGSMNFGQRSFGLSQYPGVMHGDDVFYTYRLNVITTPVLPSNEAFNVQRRVVRMWTNFFKYGNPTPSRMDPLLQATWPLLTTNEEFMDINSTLSIGVHPFRNRMDIWHAFDQRFLP